MRKEVPAGWYGHVFMAMAVCPRCPIMAMQSHGHATRGAVSAYLLKTLARGLASGTVQLVYPHDCAEDRESWHRVRRLKPSTPLRRRPW
jgi:hypothetical protein